MGQAKKLRRKIRRPFETLLFQGAVILVPLLPRPLVSLLTWLAGTMTFYFAKKERRLGMVNLDAVFGHSKTDSEKKIILKKSLVCFTRTMTDVVWFSRNTKQRVKRYHKFVPESGPYFERRAHVVVTAHVGSWELIGAESGLLGIDIASVAAVTKNQSVDKLLSELRECTGMQIIARDNAMRRLVKRLKGDGKVAFLLDQYTAEKKGGVWVDFLGLPTLISAAPAYLAYRTGTDIIFAFSQPTGGGKYEAHTGNVIKPPVYDKAKDQKEIVRQLTQQIMDVISRQIRANPEFWLWSYKYWTKRSETMPASSIAENRPLD